MSQDRGGNYSRIVKGKRHVWYADTLWQAAHGLPVEDVPVGSIAELDQDCWFFGAVPTIHAVADHCRRINEADLRFPIILHPDGSLMDGGHRLSKALLAGSATIAAVRLINVPPPDRVEPG